MADNQTIRLKDDSKINEEWIAHENLLPGSFLELETTGGTTTVKKLTQSGVGKTFAVRVAVEDALQGREVKDEYKANLTVEGKTVSDPVQVWRPQAGDIGNVLVHTTKGTGVAQDVSLVSKGDGSLEAIAGTDAIKGGMQLVAQLMEPIATTVETGAVLAKVTFI